MTGETESNYNLIAHPPSVFKREPKLKPCNDKISAFEGNYQSIYQDYVPHEATEVQHRKRVCCKVSGGEKEDMLVRSTNRILENPQLSQEVFN